MNIINRYFINKHTKHYWTKYKFFIYVFLFLISIYIIYCSYDEDLYGFRPLNHINNSLLAPIMDYNSVVRIAPYYKTPLLHFQT